MTKLVFTDGSKVFWAKDGVDVEIINSFKLPKSIKNIKAFNEWREATKLILGDYAHIHKAA